MAEAISWVVAFSAPGASKRMSTVSPGRQPRPTAMMRVPGSPSSGEIARLGRPPATRVAAAVAPATAVGVRSPARANGDEDNKLRVAPITAATTTSRSKVARMSPRRDDTGEGVFFMMPSAHANTPEINGARIARWLRHQ